MLLEVKDLVVRYGGAEALKGITFQLEERSVVTLIGANGAGKTTCLKTISGLLKPSSGEIWFKGQRIDNCSTRTIAQLGIAQVQEGKRLFPRLTVLENLEMGAFLRRDKDGIRSDFERIYRHFPVLKDRKQQKAGSLSGGEQQMLAFARGLMMKPSLLLIDEPTTGVAPILIQEFAKVMQELNQEGETILLVEQNAAMALSIARQGYVLETGSIVLHGDTQQLLKDDHVRNAYLGQ